jgi:hypothetical protein
MSKEKCIGYIVGTVIVIISILIGKSFATVDPTEYGLKCNTISKKCEMDKIYDGGRYFVGLA